MNRKISKSFALALLSLLPIQAMAATPTFSLSGHELKGDSHMEFTVTQFYPAPVSLETVVGALSDLNLKKSFSTVIVKIGKTPVNGDDSEYLISSTGSTKLLGFTITKSIGATCSETRTDSSWTQTCDAAVNYKDTSLLLKRSHTVVACNQNNEGVKCTSTSTVTPNNVKFFGIGRTAEQLCFSSTSESIRSMGHVFEYILHGQNVDAANQAYLQDHLDQWNSTFDTLWSLSDQSSLKGNVKLNGSLTSGLKYTLE